MIELKKILLPTDFSDNSNQALDYASALAQKFDAEIHLLHVLQDLIALIPEPGVALIPGDFHEELKQSAEQSLKQVLGSDSASGLSVVRATRDGTPFVEIIRYAKENDVDLIVMGTHGRSGLSHVLLGSVAERVVRKAPCPVLTVRQAGHQFVKP